jgi:hypothetical protein
MLPWREQSIGMRILIISGLLAFCFSMACMLMVGYIETAALSQPSVADSVFRHPHRIKGVVRFFTDQQEDIYSIVQPIMIPAFVVLAIFGGIHNWLTRRQEKEIERKRLDRMLGGADRAIGNGT